MPWCPKCKSEYREGFTVCADCGSKLVEKQVLESVTEEQETVENQASAETARPFPDTGESGTLSGQEQRNLYRNSSERASENRSSAWVLLIMGAIGLGILTLGMTGIAPLKFSDSYLFCGVMAAVFILFLVFGIVSMKNARIFEKKAKSENTLRSTMLEWCKENLHREEIDSKIDAEGGKSVEALYFLRFEHIKERLNHQFVNLDQGFLENFIDECVYDAIFKE